MKVFLLGGTGAIGGHALPALVAAGHEVSALVRTPHKAAAVTAQGADPVMMSMFDRAALSEAFRGHGAVVNLATSMPSTATFVLRRAWRPTERIRIEGSAAVVDAALAAGVPRLVQESVSMVYPDRGDTWINEDVELDPYPNARGNLAAEACATRFSEGGGRGIVLRLGLFYGPGARHSEQFLAMARHSRERLTRRALRGLSLCKLLNLRPRPGSRAGCEHCGKLSDGRLLQIFQGARLEAKSEHVTRSARAGACLSGARRARRCGRRLGVRGGDAATGSPPGAAG